MPPKKSAVKRITKRTLDASRQRKSRKGRFTAGAAADTFAGSSNTVLEQVDGSYDIDDDVDTRTSLPTIPELSKLTNTAIDQDVINEKGSEEEEVLPTTMLPTTSHNAFGDHLITPARTVTPSAVACADEGGPELDDLDKNLMEAFTGKSETSSDTNLPTPQPSESPRPCTPEAQAIKLNTSSSELSSVPISLGSTPDGLKYVTRNISSSAARDGSPLRRSLRTRKRSLKGAETDIVMTPSPKRRKLSDDSTSGTPSSFESVSDLTGSPDSTISSSQSTKRVRSAGKRQLIDDDELIDDDLSSQIDVKDRVRRQRKASSVDESVSSLGDGLATEAVPTKKKTKAELAYERKFYQELQNELAHNSRKSSKIWTKFKPSRVIMYGADAQTQYTPAFAEQQARRSGKNASRGTARGGRGAGNNGRSRGGKGRGKGRDEDSPEPPLPRRTQVQEDTLMIKHAKARQGELRKIFNTVGNHQAEILDALASRDLTKLCKRMKTHKQVSEYEEIVAQLNSIRQEADEVTKNFYEFAVEAENHKYEAERAAIEDAYKRKVSDIQEEHKKGAQGDLIIFRRAIAAAHDETRTQDGSEADFVPQYHECPEANQTLRGYSSTRITDEKPFKHHLSTYDDQARREVIDDDVGPIIQAFAQKNAERRAKEERQKTQTMEALAEEAEKQLKEIKGYLIPRPLWREEDVNSFALSCLADVSEYMAQKYPDKQYIYVPLEDGDTYPKEALNFDQLPGRSSKTRQRQQPPPPPPPPPPQQEVTAPTVAPPSAPAKSVPALPTSGARRSLRNLQPNGPVAPPQGQTSTPATPSVSGSGSTFAATASGPASNAVTAASVQPTIAVGLGPALAPAPPKLAPAPTPMPPGRHTQSRPPPIDTRSHSLSLTERSPVVQTPTQQSMQSSHGLPSLQPRHMSQSSLPPPPPLPHPQSHYGYPQPYSPTHPPTNSYGPPVPLPSPQAQSTMQQPQAPHHPIPSPYQPGPAPPSPYHHQQQATSPTYMPYPPPQYHHYPPPYYPPAVPQPGTQPAPSIQHQHQQQQQQQQQQFTFVSPQQGPVPQSPTIHMPMQHSDAYSNGYQAHNRSLSNPFQQPYQPVPQSQSGPQQAPIPVSTPTHTTGSKGRPRTKTKQPVTFVNQTLATRKAAAEQLAREEAAAAAEKKKDSKEKGRKLAPKVQG